MERTFLFSSESVNEGHPDKVCDQVSDAVLDTCLRADPKSKVACETATKDNMVMVAGEITTEAKLDYDKIVRIAVAGIGYDSFVTLQVACTPAKMTWTAVLATRASCLAMPAMRPQIACP